nr:MAG TPA: hypothetical protein [Caudoviricetes sp.]
MISIPLMTNINRINAKSLHSVLFSATINRPITKRS